jgi:hypothetical protein
MMATVERFFRDEGGVMTSLQVAQDFLCDPAFGVLAKIARLLPGISRNRGRNSSRQPRGSGGFGELQWRNTVTTFEMLCQPTLIAKPGRDCRQSRDR